MLTKLLYAAFAAGYIALVSVGVSAQESPDPAQMALKYSQTKAANGKALMAYTWQQRTQLNHQGEEAFVKLVQVHFDAQGQSQTTEISQQSFAKKERGLRKTVENKKVGELKEELQGLVKLAESYVMMTEGQTVDFFQKAKITADAESPNIVEISGTDVLNKGDSVQLWMEKTTFVPWKMSFTVIANEDTVTTKVDYRSLKSGPYYAAQITLGIPAKEMQIQVEDYDFAAQN